MMNSASGQGKAAVKVYWIGSWLVSFFVKTSRCLKKEKVLDKRTSMGVIGNIGQYARYQSAEAIRDAAQNEGGGLAGRGRNWRRRHWEK